MWSVLSLCNVHWFVVAQLGEYSDPFDLKEKAAADRETVESASGVILPLSEDDYSVPYEMKDRHRGKMRNNKWKAQITGIFSITIRNSRDISLV